MFVSAVTLERWQSLQHIADLYVSVEINNRDVNMLCSFDVCVCYVAQTDLYSIVWCSIV